MRTRRTHCFWIAAVLSVVVTRPLAQQGSEQAQEQGPKPGLVRCSVQQADGSPWAAAEVLFVSRAIATDPELKGAAVVRARTNDRGVARARLQKGRAWSCWAQGEGQQDDTYRTSEVLEGVRAGDVLRLKATGPAQKQYHVHLQGLDAWKQLAPFSVRVISTGPVNVHWQTVGLDEQDAFRMPRMPGPVCFVQVFGKDLYPIHQEPVPIDAGTWARARKYRIGLQDKHALQGLDPGAEAKSYVVPIPPPAMARVLVTDPAGKGLVGKGIADATLFRDPLQARAPWYRIAKTNATGHATFPIAVYRRKDGSGYALHLDLLARAKEHADTWEPKEGLEFDKAGGTPELTLVMAPGHTGRGTLLLTEGQPLEDQELILFSSVQRGNNGGQIGIGPYRFGTDKQGRFRLRGRSGNYVWRLCTQLSPRQIGRLGLTGKYPIAPLVWLASLDGKTETEVALRLDRFVPVDLQILGRDGSPDPDARIWLGEVEKGSKAPHYPLRYRPNRLGRLRILLAPGSSVLVYVRGLRGAALQEIQVPKTARRTGWPLEISLAQSRVLRGRVLDDRGTVVQDAFVRVSQTKYDKETSGWRVLSNWQTMAMLSNSSEPWAYNGRELHPNRIWRSRQWIYFAHPATQVSCNDKGEFELWLPKQQQAVTFQASRLSEGKWQKSSASNHKLDELTDDPVEIVIQD